HPDAAGQRFIATSDDKVVWVQDMVDILKQSLPEADTKKLPTRALPNLLLKVVGFFDATTRLIVPYLGNPMPLSNAKAKNVLGWQPRTAKDALLAS
ncbi:UNVERIFIED_CONTAM: aldehyde reductase, partial [Bacteroidetes bacterium 56_B9]